MLITPATLEGFRRSSTRSDEACVARAVLSGSFSRRLEDSETTIRKQDRNQSYQLTYRSAISARDANNVQFCVSERRNERAGRIIRPRLRRCKDDEAGLKVPIRAPNACPVELGGKKLTAAIIISADHDPATQALSTYAAVIEATATSAMRFHNKPAPEIHKFLSKSKNDHIFIFVHGRHNPPSVIDRFGSAVLDASSMHLLRARTVCGTCFSLNGFADLAIPHGASVVGYDGRMLIPLDPRYLAEMQSAALAAHREVLNGATAAAAAQTARAEYRDIARRWFSKGSLKGQIYGALAQANANALGARP